MAITLTAVQDQGNPARTAMLLLDFDDEVSIPSGAEITVTVAVLDAAGGNVDASAAITTTAGSILTTDAFAEEFLEDLQAALDGAYVFLSKNTSDQYVYHFKAKHDLAQTVNLSLAGYDPSPA